MSNDVWKLLVQKTAIPGPWSSGLDDCAAMPVVGLADSWWRKIWRVFVVRCAHRHR